MTTPNIFNRENKQSANNRRQSLGIFNKIDSYYSHQLPPFQGLNLNKKKILQQSYTDRLKSKREGIANRTNELNLRYSFVLIEHPQKETSFNKVQEFKKNIKQNKEYFLNIAAGFIDRVILLQQKKIFNPDFLTIEHAIFDEDLNLINTMKREKSPKMSLNQWINFSQSSLNFQNLINAFKKKHETIRNMYSYSQIGRIYKEFSKEIDKLADTLQKVKNGTDRNTLQLQIEKIVQNFIKEENIRLLLYIFDLINDINLYSLEKKDKVYVEFRRYFDALVALDSSQRNIQKIKIKFQRIFSKTKPQQKLLQSGEIITESRKIVVEEVDRQVGSGSLELFIQKSSSNFEPFEFLQDNIRMKILKLQKRQPETLSKKIFSYREIKENVCKINEQKQEIIHDDNLKLNLKLNIINLLEKKETNYIAKYKVNLIKRDKDNQNLITECEYEMERGEDQFSEYGRKSIGNISIEHLFMQGKDQVIGFLLSLLQGIVELEEIGIFHADITPQNFIQFKNIFEIIDFDHALLCKFDRRQQSVFEFLTRQALKSWLTHKHNTVYAIFEHDELFINIKDKFRRQDEKDLPKYINKCLEQLPHLQKVGHKNQLKTIFHQIFHEERYGNIFNERQRSAVFQMYKNFIQIGEPQYLRFCAEIYQLFYPHQANSSHFSQNLLLCGKKVEFAATELKMKSSSPEQINQNLIRMINLNEYLGHKKLKNISKPYPHHSFVIKDQDGEICDYKLVYRDDSHEISKKDIWKEGEAFIYQVIYKLIKIGKELDALQIYYPKLQLQCLVKKSNTVLLRNLKEAEMLNQNYQQLQNNHQLQHDYMKQIIEKAVWRVLEELKRQYNFEGFNLSRYSPRRIGNNLRQEKKSNMKRIKQLISELIKIPYETVDKLQNDYSRFLNNQKGQIEKLLKKTTIENGYDELEHYIKQKRREKMPRQLIWSN